MTSKINSYRDLIAWQKAVVLADSVYAITEPFPQREMYGLASQLRRSAVSVPSNIAEGSVRGNKEFLHFLNIARGSLAEIETQLLIANNQQLITVDNHTKLITLTDELSRILMGLLKSLKSNN